MRCRSTDRLVRLLVCAGLDLAALSGRTAVHRGHYGQKTYGESTDSQIHRRWSPRTPPRGHSADTSPRRPTSVPVPGFSVIESDRFSVPPGYERYLATDMLLARCVRTQCRKVLVYLVPFETFW